MLKGNLQMKKRNNKKINMKLRTIVSNNYFAFKLLLQACPGKIIYSIMSSLSNAARALISLYFLRFAINEAQKDNGSYLNVLKWLTMLCIVHFVYAILKVLIDNYFSPHFDAMVKKKLKRLLLMKTAECEIACYENPEFYDKYTRAMAEGASCCNNVLNSLSNIISAIVNLIGCSFLIFLADPFLFLFLVFPFVQMLIEKKQKKLSYEMNCAEDPVRRRLSYPMRIFYQSEYAKELRVSNISRPLLERFRKAFDDTMQLKRTYGKRKVFWGLIGDTFSNFTQYYLNYCYLAWRTIVDKSMMVGECFVAATAMFSVQGAVWSIGYYLLGFYEQALFINNLRYFMDYTPSIAKNENGPVARNGDIVFRNVSFSYSGSSHETLRHITLTIHRGEKIAIVGLNGAGKTTFTKLLLRLYDPTEGEIMLDGDDIRTIQLESYRDMFATVLQDYRHFSMTVAENVLMRTSKEGDDDRVNSALKKSGAYDFVMSYPNKTATILDREFNDEGVVLSGGQAQMLAIAHVYAKNSPIVILDEPSSALDPITEYEMYQKMMQACCDRTVVFISHRLSSTVMADRIVFLERGEIVETGTHDELMKINGRYAALFRVQAENYAGTKKKRSYVDAIKR